MEVLRKYATSTRILFPLVTLNSTTLLAGATIAANDIEISKDEGSFIATGDSSLFVEIENGMYYVVTDGTDMTCARFTIKVVDQTNPKEWEDQIIVGSTYGNASAEHGDSVWDEVKTDHKTVGSFGELGALAITGGLVESSGSNSSTQVQTDLGEATNDQYKDQTIVFIKAASVVLGESRSIASYVGSTGVITWTTALVGGTPPDADSFVILPFGGDAAAIKAKTDSLTFTVAGLVDSNPIRVASSQGAADRLGRFFGDACVWGTSDSGTTTTMVDANRTETDTAFKGHTISFTSGTNINRSALITGFTASSDTLTFTPALADAVTTENYIIHPSGHAGVEAWARTPATLSSTSLLPEVDIKSVSDNTAAAVTLQKALTSSPTGTVDHSAFTATTTVFESNDVNDSAADHWNGRVVLFTDGVLNGHVTAISDYVLSGSNGRFTVSTMPTAPVDNATFVIL